MLGSHPCQKHGKVLRPATVSSRAGRFHFSPTILPYGAFRAVAALGRRDGLPVFTRQVLVGQALARHLRERQSEAAVVVHVFALVETETLFIEIPEQVEWFNTHVRPVDAALQQTPEILKPVGVNVSVHVGYRVVNNLMLKFVQPFVGF